MSESGAPAGQGPVVVVGAGVVGMAVALELALTGVRVTVLERAEVGAGASHGNAGMLVPSHCVPLARPAALASGLRGLAGRGGALRLGPWQDPAQWAWLSRFVFASRPGHGWRLAPAIHRLARLSIARYQELLGPEGTAAVDMSPSGWLSIYESRAGLRRGLSEVRRLERLGESWRLLDRGELASAEPALARPTAGAILHLGDWVVSPDRLLRRLADLALAAGAEVSTGAGMVDVVTTGRRVSFAVGDRGRIPVGQLVLAAGWENEGWLRRLGFRGHIYPARGYSITVARSGNAPVRPLSLVDRHLVISVLGDRVRATTGLDLGPPASLPPKPRFEWLRATARSWLPDLSWEEPLEEWTGVRPLTPDDRPLIGPVPGWDNVLVAGGHGMLGVTLGAGTGTVIRDWITRRHPPSEGTQFRPR